jgi:hypothetical protein
MAMTLAAMAPLNVAAQSGTPTAPQSVEDLRRRLEELERTMKAEIEVLRAQFSQQEAELARLRLASPTSPAAPGVPAERRLRCGCSIRDGRSLAEVRYGNPQTGKQSAGIARRCQSALVTVIS